MARSAIASSARGVAGSTPSARAVGGSRASPRPAFRLASPKAAGPVSKVQVGAEGVVVGRRSDAPGPLGLLGSHVRRGADVAPVETPTRSRRGRRGTLPSASDRTFATPQSMTSTSPKAPIITFSGFRSQMHHAPRVRERDRFADALEGPEPLGQRHPAGRQLVEALAVDPLHRVEDAAVREHPRVVDAHDARVLEARDDARLRAHALHDLRARGGGRHDLEATRRPRTVSSAI